MAAQVGQTVVPLQAASADPTPPESVSAETKISIADPRSLASAPKRVTRADLAALDVDPSRPRPWTSKSKGHRMVGKRRLWKRNILDHTRHFLLSPSFQQGAQVAMGVFLGGLFVFVRPITFSLSFLATLFVPVGILALSPDRHAGSRIMAAAFLGLMSWGLIFGACLITVARQTGVGAYTGSLVAFSIIFFFFTAVMRSMNVLVGIFIAIFAGLIILIAQFVYPAYLLWHAVTWGLIRGVWFSVAMTILVGTCVLASSAREAIAIELASHLMHAGHALSAVASHLMQPKSQDDAARLRKAEDYLQAAMSIDGLDVPEVLMEAQWKHSTDAKGDHSLRHADDPAVRTIGSLRPAMMGSKVLLKTAPFEPCWFCGCRVPLDAWGPIFAQTEAFATRISVLEALLEGASAGASASGLSSLIGNMAKGRPSQICNVATDSAEGLRKQARITFEQCHKGTADAYQRGQHANMLQMSPQGDPGVKPAAAASAAQSEGPWELRDGRTLVKMDFKKRLKMELEPFIMFVSIMCGLPMFMIPKDVFQKVVPRTFGSWSMAWNTIRHNRDFHFGVKFYMATAGTMAVLLPLTVHYSYIRQQSQFYLFVAVPASLMERADATLTRGVLRLTMTAAAGALGYVVMLRPVVATNTYALSVIGSTVGFLIGVFCTSTFKYAGFLAILAFNSLVYNQYSPVPGSHGKTSYFVVRVVDYAIGIGIAFVISSIAPWYLAGDALQRLGVSFEASTKIAASLMRAYCEEVEQLGWEGKRQNSQGHLQVTQAEEAKESAEPAKKQGKEQKKKKKAATVKPAASKPNLGSIGSLQSKDIATQIADPLGATFMQVGKEAVLWKHGLMTLPDTVAISLSRVQVTLERVALLFMMVRAPAFVTGKFTCAPYAAMLRPMKPELDAMLGGLEQLGKAVARILHETSSLQDFEELQASVNSLEAARHAARDRIRRLREEFRSTGQHTAEGQQIMHASSEDDWFRFFGVLLALGKMCERSMLSANMLLENKWLKQRAGRSRIWRNVSYIW
ncbi:hypothetical protein WJX84_009578 [Apatococcus fuscideae]|uniref:Uncharacterized protein n=1 Tax=Apatococcus fuscideae TaxID=2026836 RepID=A0AAW1T5B8_9CHLO